jgi:hypothetical protein
MLQLHHCWAIRKRRLAGHLGGATRLSPMRRRWARCNRDSEPPPPTVQVLVESSSLRGTATQLSSPHPVRYIKRRDPRWQPLNVNNWFNKIQGMQDKQFSCTNSVTSVRERTITIEWPAAVGGLCQLLRTEGVPWSAWRILTEVFSFF